ARRRSHRRAWLGAVLVHRLETGNLQVGMLVMTRIARIAAAAIVFAGPVAARAPARAQAPLAIPDRYSFYLVLGADTIVDERVWRTPTELHGEFLDRRRGARLQYLAALTADGSISTVATRSYRTAGDTGEIATFHVDSAAVSV